MNKHATSAVLGLLLASSVIAHDLQQQAAKTACSVYLGNEGVLVSSGSRKLLFDAFYSDSYNRYALVPDAMLKGARSCGIFCRLTGLLVYTCPLPPQAVAQS